VLDFSSCPGMDDSSPLEFKTFVAAAKKVGISLMFCGCKPNLLLKLHKAGVFPAEETITIQDEDCLGAHGKEIADSNKFGVYLSANMDRAIELAELALALRSVHLCGDVIPEPTHEMQELGNLFRNELAPHRMELSKGQKVETKAGQTFVLLEGAVEATVDFCNRHSNSLRSEAMVVYRTVPGLDGDFCFSGSVRGGSLQAVSDTTLVMLQRDALDELQRMGRGPAIEIVWSQMAEFMAATMQPLALKASMHDVNGRFSSYAAEAFNIAVADVAKTAGRDPASGEWTVEDQQEVMRRILNAEEYGGKLRDLIRKNTINFSGERPVFAALKSTGSPPTGLDAIAMQLPGICAQDARSPGAMTMAKAANELEHLIHSLGLSPFHRNDAGQPYRKLDSNSKGIEAAIEGDAAMLGEMQVSVSPEESELYRLVSSSSELQSSQNQPITIGKTTDQDASV